MKDKQPMEQVCADAVELAGTVDGQSSRVAELRESVPLDLDEVSAEMVSWEECPTLELYVHGCLNMALKDLRDASKHLARAGSATTETIRQEWLRLRGAGGAP